MTDTMTTNHKPNDLCNTCHRNVSHPRLTLRVLFTDAMQNLFNLERGLIYTAIMLWKNPHEVISNFISGDRLRYMNPFRMLFTAVTLSALIVSAFGMSFAEIVGIDPNDPTTGLKVVMEYTDVFMMLSVPLLSLGTWIAFGNAKLNFAEHLVINAFGYSAMTLAQLPLDFIFSAFIPSIDPYWESLSGFFILYTIYFYIKAFQTSVISGLIRFIIATVITMVVGFAFVAGAILLYTANK
ncbi:MAG: DUF3667 domain-containing protein [Flavobacteriales bacterium]